MVLTDGLPLVRMMAEYPVNALVIVVVIFLFGWPLSGDGVRFAVGRVVGNSKIADFEMSGDGTRLGFNDSSFRCCGVTVAAEQVVDVALCCIHSSNRAPWVDWSLGFLGGIRALLTKRAQIERGDLSVLGDAGSLKGWGKLGDVSEGQLVGILGWVKFGGVAAGFSKHRDNFRCAVVFVCDCEDLVGVGHAQTLAPYFRFCND